ncbi:MAG: glycoside hydrolase family 13 protein [Clostridia bacterium]|jgi:glycosidase|nr:glycoside hydrolase family 13 protein [Clostridia bacterium]
MNYYFNPLDETCKSITGAIPRNQKITFHIEETEGGEENFSAQTCYFMYCLDGLPEEEIPMERVNNGFSITLQFNQIGLYFYRFRLNERILGCGNLRSGSFQSQKSWQLTVYKNDYQTPDWIKGGIMYQIFPDRFYKVGNIPIKDNKVLREDWGGLPNYKPNHLGKVLNNDFFGGNLNGIIEKLEYLKNLNVSVIYLNPIFEAYSNHRYDTGDYMKIDPLLGTEQDFARLISTAKGLGIHIILDGVFNHTGDDSRYFNKYGTYKEELGAHQSPDSPYIDWFNFEDYPSKYDSWWGIETLPAVNERSQSYQEFIFGQNGVLKHWLRHGIDGYRLDVADELPDFFLEKLRKAVKDESSEAIIIGEVWEDASNKISYDERRHYFLGSELDSVMNYPLKDAIIRFILSGDTSQLRETIFMLIDHYPKQSLDCLMNILGTHDTPRILTALAGKPCYEKDEMAITSMTSEELEKGLLRVKMAAVLQFTLPGVPCIYYGDETAMEGYQDPFCRKCMNWSNPDKSLETFYKTLGKIRKEQFQEVFKTGLYREIFANRSCIVYERKTHNQSVFVYVNNSSEKFTIHLNGDFIEHINGITFKNKLEITEYSYGIISKI